MTTVKVLFITRKWPPAIGGMETYSYEISKELEKRVYLTTKVLPGMKNGKPPCILSLTFFFIKTAFFLITHRNKFNIVHFGDLVLFPLAWLDSKLSPTHVRILTLHGLDIIYGNRKGLIPYLYKGLVNYFSKNAQSINAFISNSQNTARLAKQKKLTPVHPISLGVTTQKYLMPKQFPSNTPKRFLFFFGRIVKRKGLSWFLSNVLDHLPSDIVLLAAGNIWDQNEIKNYPQNRFQHLGIISDELLTYYCRHSSAVIIPNIQNPEITDVEGFGLVTLEAAARGGIVLASATEGIVDAVRDTETGFLLTPENPSEWINKINEILEWNEEQRTIFKAHSAEVLKQYYSWNRVAQDTLSIYQKYSS